MRADVLAICVHYLNDEDTCNHINDLLAQQKGLSLDIIIVDNSELDVQSETLGALASSSENVQLLSSEKNIGYFGAASFALQRYLLDSEMPEWVIVSNSDIRLTDPDFLTTLMQVRDGGTPGVVAPRIISRLTGLDQNPFMRKRPSALKMHSYRLIFRFSTTYFIYSFLHKAKIKVLSNIQERDTGKCEESEGCYIYAPHGSIIAFNEEYFEKGGTLEYGCFLFDEEILVAETASRLGLRILYEPRMRAFHREHATTTMTKEMLKYKYESAKFCAREFFPVLGERLTKHGPGDSCVPY